MKINNVTIEPRALLTELVGTFILASVAVTVGNPIIVGFVLIVLVLSMGGISGAHLNPAITFGMWAVKRLESVKLPFYWAAQMLGALLAILTIQSFKGVDMGISLASFGSFDGRLVAIEVLGTAVFAMAMAAAIHRGLSDGAKAVAVGFGLLTGLAVGGGFLGTSLQQSNLETSGSAAARVTKVDGAILNPAIALVATEKAEQAASYDQLTGETKANTNKKEVSRFTWETVVGALAGGALGMNLYFFLAGVNPFKQESLKTKVVKKVKGKK